LPRMHVARALRLAACRSTQLRTPPTVLQCAHSPPRLALWRACSTSAAASATAADAIVALSSDRQRVAQWLQAYFDWKLLTPKVAESMPQEAVDKFDELQAEKICDVFKIRYGFRDRDVEQLVSEHSAVLGYSLKHQILPAVNILEKDLELGTSDHPDVLMRRIILRVPQMLANDLSDPELRADFALHAKRVLHLSDVETKDLMKVVPKAGKPLQRLNMR
jgi:hypothetical protein